MVSAVQNAKLNPIDLDAAAEAERFGALAVSRHSKNNRAKMTKNGLTTAQRRALINSASDLVNIMKRVKKVHAGRMTVAFSTRGDTETVEIQGLKRALAHT